MATAATKAPMVSIMFGSMFTATVQQRGKKFFEAVRTVRTEFKSNFTPQQFKTIPALKTLMQVTKLVWLVHNCPL